MYKISSQKYITKGEIMLNKIVHYFKLLLFFDVNATTYHKFDVRSFVAKKSRGNIQLQQGKYITQKEYDAFRKRVLSFDYSSISSEQK